MAAVLLMLGYGGVWWNAHDARSIVPDGIHMDIMVLPDGIHISIMMCLYHAHSCHNKILEYGGRRGRAAAKCQLCGQYSASVNF